jgi:hypothetical protein
MEPITHLNQADQQHMLFMFVPVKAGKKHLVNQALTSAKQSFAEANDDMRALTGVHFFMFYHLDAGGSANLPIKSFEAPADKGLLVVQAIYDADFVPYISSFVDNPKVAFFLDILLDYIDEDGIFDLDDPTSAVSIKANGGVALNKTAFICLLMRYNFSDPTIPAAAKSTKEEKFVLGYTFPGLTVGNILANYPHAHELWPSPPITIQFEESVPPEQC